MLKKVATADLRVGMFVHDLGLSWWQHDFVLPRFPIDSQDTLDRILRTKAKFVTIDDSKCVDPHEMGAAAATSAHAGATPTMHELLSPSVPAASRLRAPSAMASAHVSLEDELGVARKLIKEAHSVVRSAMSEARTGKISALPHLHDLAEGMVESASRNAGAMLSLLGLKAKDDYTFMHCVSVGTFMIALGKQFGLSEDELVDAGTAGLLHDVGKGEIAADVLNRVGHLSEPELDAMRQHPQMGYRRLREAGFQDSVALEVVLHHHERLDGSGYPDRLSGEQITRLARMGAVVDVYDAMTSDRCYRKAEPPTAVLRHLLGESGTRFDPMIVQTFIKTVGIYPNGSLVRLQSGRLAVVMEQSDTHALAPRVRLFYSTKSKMPIPTEDVDLALDQGDVITGYEDPRVWGFDLSKVSGITL